MKKVSPRKSQTHQNQNSKSSTKNKTDMQNNQSGTVVTITCGGRGGTGKTSVLVAIADYLESRGTKRALIDCDTENAGQPTCFSHWLDGKGNVLNLRNPDDRDRLLTDSAESGVPFVLVDLPANATGDISIWLQDVATAALIRDMGLTVIALGVVTPSPGSARSVVKWVENLGDRARYLVALNRIDYEMVPGPTEKVFAEWFEVAVPALVPAIVSADRIQTIEIPNMEAHGMAAMVNLGKLPSKALQTPTLHLLHKQRIKTWRDRIYAQLDATGLFSAKESKEKSHASAV